MTAEYKQQLIDAGVNVDSALDRFMGLEAMYDKFLLKFLQDESYAKMTESIHSGDAEKAFMQAHAMKGVAGNLGMASLLEVLNPMTEQLRNGDMSHIREEYEDLKQRYDKLSAVIQLNSK